MPVGGIKEKVLGAMRAGITTIIIPRRNEKDLDDIPASIKDKLSFCLVDHVEQVLEFALMEKPEGKLEGNGTWVSHLEEGVSVSTKSTNFN